VRYSPAFYEQQAPGARRSARAIVPLVLELVQPRSAVDVGCGVGTWLSVFAELGIDDVLGVDGDWVDPEALEIPRERFLAFDLTEPLSLDRTFDLVVSLEVGEHLPAETAPVYVQSLVRLGPVVLFSAAIPFQRGTHHVNEQWPAYWAELFEAHGYVGLDCIRPGIWNDDDVDWHYAQNTLLYADRAVLARSERLSDELRRANGVPLPLVHPKKLAAELARARELLPIVEELAALIPEGARFVLVDHEVFREDVAATRTALPFLERDGEYWGPPPDDETAIAELERLRGEGASFAVFGSPAFWWLEHYGGLAAHLRERYACVLDNDRLLAFDLRR
jgi:SAM-dependent methyltransferase